MLDNKLDEQADDGRKKAGSRRRVRRHRLRPRTVFRLLSPRTAGLPRLPPPYDVRDVASWPVLFELLAAASPSALVLLEPFPGDGRSAGELAELRARFPSVAVIAVVELVPARVADVRALLDAGVSEVVSVRRDRAAWLLAERLRGAYARPFKRRLGGALSPYTGGDARTLLWAAAETVAEAGRVGDLAARFGVMQKTLVGWCRAAALPPPRRLMTWMRVLLAAHLLEDPGRTVGSAAAGSGYATDRSLRRVMNGFLGEPTRALRRAGVFDAAMQVFNAELRAQREVLRTAHRRPPKVVVPMQASDVQGAPPASDAG